MTTRADIFSIEPQTQSSSTSVVMGGDVTGPSNASTVSGIQGVPVDPTPPTMGQILEFDGTEWTPTTTSIPPSTANANTVYAGPTTGAPATPSFRGLVSADIPTGIPATNIATGAVDNTEFGYLDGVTSSIQTQINNKLDSTSNKLNPTPTTAGKVIYDTGSAYAETAAGTTNQVLVGGATPTFGSVPVAAMPTGIPATSIGSGTVDNTELGYLDGVTSNIQTQLDAKQSALTLPLSEANGGFGQNASTIGTGLVARTAANTYTARSITAPAAGITITNPGGIAGNPTLALADDLAAVEGMFGVGIAVRSAVSTWTTRSVSAGTGVSVSNGDGIAGNPTVSVNYGTTSTTATVGNDTRLPPAPTAGGKILYDTGSAYAETAAGTSGSQILVSGGTGSPTWGTRGGSVITFYLNTGQSFVTNGYCGLAGDGSSTVNVNVTPWVVPVAGTLSNLRVFGLSNTSGSVAVTIYKASSAVSPSYASTALTCTVSGGTFSGSDTTHTVSVSAGELIVAFTSASWSANGAVINVMYYPT